MAGQEETLKPIPPRFTKDSFPLFPEECAAYTEVLNITPVETGLGRDVDRIAAFSPTMQQQLREVKAKGWQFLYSDRSVTDNEHSVVFINTNLYGKPQDVVTTLAHELGHVFHPTRSRSETFNGEAYATINNIKIINEINKTGCYKIDVTAGKKTAILYSQAYDKMLKTGNIQQALKTIGHVYKCYETTNMGISYAEYYHADTSDCKK